MMLELNNIRKSFSDNPGRSSSLLEDISMSVKEGRVTALIGGNGAGKTTLFNIISGFDKDFNGKVYFNGRDISRLPAYRISRMGIGRLFQGRQLMEDLTLMENFKIASDDMSSDGPLASIFHFRDTAESEAAKEKKAIGLLERFFPDDDRYLKKLGERASALSYGEQRLMALIRLLMRDSGDRMLLLDEPTSGINPKNSGTFRRIIREMVEKDGVTVLMIEHNMSFVRSVADCCYYMSEGRILKSGNVDEILDDPLIRKDYLGL